jgi:outer membrane cobalamin receptor
MRVYVMQAVRGIVDVVARHQAQAEMPAVVAGGGVHLSKEVKASASSMVASQVQQ